MSARRRCGTCGRVMVMATLTECKTCHHWRQVHGEARPPRPTRSCPPAGAVTTRVLVAATGLTFRQVDYATRTGRVAPSIGDASGSGSTRWWSEADVAALSLVKARLDWGLTLEAACRTEDPPFPTAVDLVEVAS